MKKFLSIFSVIIAVMITVSAIYANAECISSDEWIVFNGAQVTGNSADGFSVQVPYQHPNYKFASMISSENCVDNAIIFNTPIIEDESYSQNRYMILSVTNRAVSSLSDMIGDTSIDGVHLVFRYDSSTGRIIIRDGRNESKMFASMAYGDNTEHRIEFVNQDGKWYLSFDGSVKTGVDLTDYVTPLINSEVHYTFTSGSATAEIDGFKLVNCSTTAGATVSGNPVDGYSLSFPFGNSTYRFASIKSANDCTVNTLLFKAPQIANGTFVQLCMTKEAMSSNADVRGTTIKAGLHLRLTPYVTESVNKIIIALFDGTNLTNICSFDYVEGEEHSVAFVKSGEKWYLSFDGMARTNVDLTNYITPLLGNGIYYTFTSSSGTAKMDGVKVLPLTVNNNATLSGDELNGYSLQVPFKSVTYSFASMMSTNSATENVFVFKTPKINNNPGDTTVNDSNEYIRFGITADAVSGINDMRNDTILPGVHLEFYRRRTENKILMKLNKGTSQLEICYFDYDENAEHSIAFVKEDEKWYLSFDGTVYKTNQWNQDLDLTAYVNKISSGKTYYTFTSASANAQVDGAKLALLTACQAKGAQIDGDIERIYSDSINWYFYNSEIAAYTNPKANLKPFVTKNSELGEISGYLASLKPVDDNNDFVELRAMLLEESTDDPSNSYDYYHDDKLDILDLVRVRKMIA